MNYTWQVPRWYHLPGSWHCGYSPAALPSLDESNLNEWDGLNPPQNVVPIVSVPFTDPLGKIQYARLDWGIPADWNNDSLLTNPVAVDLNLVGEPTGVTNPGQPLVSHADWPNLQYNFRKSSAFSPSGVLRVQSVSQESPPEMTRDVYDRLNAMPAPKPVGQFLMDGQLDSTASLRASHGGASLYASYRSPNSLIWAPMYIYLYLFSPRYL